MIAFTKTHEARLLKSADGHYYLRGIVSDDKVDHDGDRISLDLLAKWADTINTGNINVFTDHSHQLWDTVGVWKNAVVKDGQLWAEARLEDPTVNPKVAALIAKFEAGERIGISIGGDMTKSEDEFDYHANKPVRKITEANLFEASLVGIPSNQRAYVAGLQFKSWEPLFDKRRSGGHAWSQQIMQNEAARNYVAELRQYQQIHEQLHGVNAEHDTSICRQCREERKPSQPVVVQQFVPPQKQEEGDAQPKTGNPSLRTETPLDRVARLSRSPEGKIAAEPGKSGSSEVFRTNLGQKIDVNKDIVDFLIEKVNAENPVARTLTYKQKREAFEWAFKNSPEYAELAAVHDLTKEAVQKGDINITIQNADGKEPTVITPEDIRDLNADTSEEMRDGDFDSQPGGRPRRDDQRVSNRLEEGRAATSLGVKTEEDAVANRSMTGNEHALAEDDESIGSSETGVGTSTFREEAGYLPGAMEELPELGERQEDEDVSVGMGSLREGRRGIKYAR